jgi:glucosamine kinase
MHSKLFLGVDGGQSHTEAVIGDIEGRVVGRGFGGPSNHAERPGGRERLREAVLSSVGEALRNSCSPTIDEVVFASAEFGMTGGADFKEEIIRGLVKADHLVVDHDAPTALFGSTAGQPGIVVISGTGSVIYGENESGKRAKIGGLGYLFSDEGSGFWLAAQTIRLAIKEQDGLIPACGLQNLVLGFFRRSSIRDLTNDFYNEKIDRDDLARLAEPAQEAARAGNDVLRLELEYGVGVLVRSVKTAAANLALTDSFPVAGVGGMFRGELMKSLFAETLAREVPSAVFIAPRCGPAIGALLMAYRNAGVPLEPGLLENLERTSTI